MNSITRRIILIRHAKSSWANPLQSDYDRPLNERGLHDAPMMGARLKARAIIPDLIISSPAKRAAKTATLIAAAIGYPEEKIHWQEKFYHCNANIFEEAVAAMDDTVKTVFIVAHNPGISEFAIDASASGADRISDMPTCAMAGIELKAKHWYDYPHAVKKVFLFDYPKKENE